MDFNLNSYFNAFDIDKPASCEHTELKLSTTTTSLADNPESLHSNPELFEDLLELLSAYSSVPIPHQKSLVYLLTSSFCAVGEQIHHLITSGNFINFIASYKSLLEKYGFLMFVCLKNLAKLDYTAKSKGSTSNNNSDSLKNWKSNALQIEDCLTSIVFILKIDLEKIFITTPERDLFIELFSRPIINLMESPERMKIIPIKLLMFKIISLSVRNHGHSTIIQHSIIQCLTYYVHLPQYMAELLSILANDYEYYQLTEDVLKEISQTHFNSNDSNGPKSIANFLIKLSELSPRLILKQLISIKKLLDNSNFTLRCSVVETCGNIVVDIIRDTNENDNNDVHNTSSQISGLLDLLQDRFLDSSPFVRTKAFQALTKVAALKVQLTERRQNMMALCVQSLDDKSTLVRRNTIKLMSKLLLNHQFSNTNGSQLKLSIWNKQLQEAELELENLLPNRKIQLKNVDSDEEMDDIEKELSQIVESDEEDDDNDARKKREGDKLDDEPDINEEDHLEREGTEVVRARLKVKLLEDAVDFISAVHKGTQAISDLLFSKNRNETLDCMDFLVLADAYGIEKSKEGIRRMLHLVWMKGNSDEGKSVPTHLIDCYTNLFLKAPQTLSNMEQAAYIAKNLINLTIGASISDIASLQKLLGLIYQQKLINTDVLTVLWQIYNYELGNDKGIQQRHGSIIILGMLALENNQIIVKGLDSLLNVGLGEPGKTDLILAKHTCVALQRIVPTVSKNDLTIFKIVREEETVDKLRAVLLEYEENSEWFSVAEQAISAIFQASSEPDKVCSEIIKAKSKSIYENNGNISKVNTLSQLIFIVGHIAIKTIVYLEKLEAQFKKKKHEAEGKKNKSKDEEQANELEMIGGTSEDDFTDAILHVKERELLYSEESLLGRFGPLVRDICANNNNYNNKILQRSAVLCLGKLMCVSSIYCEENLHLLITIMEKSDAPIIRSNCVIALGDMAVCFNNIIDESTDYLYKRLDDDNIMVQRTCLMTVTFLILAGQVKVKGQLYSMAKCLENEDQGISDMCKLFFTELSTKDNAIYNGFIDIFSGLSNDKTLGKDAFKRIIKFLLSFIDKEKHQKQLAEKLITKINQASSEEQWNEAAFALSSIPFKNEAITTILDEGYKQAKAR